MFLQQFKIKTIFVGILLEIYSINCCEYKTYEYRLNPKINSKIYLNVNYQYPNGPSYEIYRDNKLVQEVYMNDNLGAQIELYDIKNGFVLQGKHKQIHITLDVDEEEFVQFRIFKELIGFEIGRDCLSLENNTHWYGGPEQSNQQYWPIQSMSLEDYSYVTKQDDAAAVIERYWLNSKGVFAYVSFDTPLFITQTPNELLCFVAQKKLPYSTTNERFVLDYFIGVGLNPKQVHMKAIKLHLKKPTNIPDERMVTHPIWSTWARYKTHINESLVKKFASEIEQYEFKNSQLEIDDDWEECYGSLIINDKKFPDMKALVDDLHDRKFRVTIWIHPFINKDCQPWYDTAKSKGYFVLDQNGNSDTSWWNSRRNEAALIDFTNPEAAKWFTERLNLLREEYGIDSFKFDAGESGWTPPNPVLNGDKKHYPNIYTRMFVDTLSQFGSMIEIRTGWGTQNLPVFVRMLDKDSEWCIENNGLHSLITTLLQMNMNGYPFVLPDMVGGNGYEGAPDKELYIRWLEANVFMPTIQYSYVPWDFDEKTVLIARWLTEMRENFAAPIIIEAMKKAVLDGTPVNPPIWWIDPYDHEALGIGDEFLLGETILVAPILEQGKTSRDVYLPEGKWKSSNQSIYGKGWIRDFPAPLGSILYFTKLDTIKSEL